MKYSKYYIKIWFLDESVHINVPLDETLNVLHNGLPICNDISENVPLEEEILDSSLCNKVSNSPPSLSASSQSDPFTASSDEDPDYQNSSSSSSSSASDGEPEKQISPVSNDNSPSKKCRKRK